MVDNHDLERLCAALDSGPTDLRATEPLLALRRLLLQLERLDEPARAALDRATHDLHPVIQTLEEAAKSGSLAPDALRDLSTLRRRLEVSCELLRGRASADPSRGEALRVSYAPSIWRPCSSRHGRPCASSRPTGVSPSRSRCRASCRASS